MIVGIENAVDQVVAILQANLGAELALIQAERADWIVLDSIRPEPISSSRTSPHSTRTIGRFLVYPTASRPLQYDSVTNTPGRRVAEDVITVEILVKDTANEQPDVTQKRVLRYDLAMMRVLPIKNVTLGGMVNRCTRTARRPTRPVTVS